MLRVYQGTVIDWKRSKEPYHGQCRAIVAASSWAAAHRVVSQRIPNMTLGHMRNYWTITGNAKQIVAATAHPLKLLLSSTSMSDDYVLAG